MLILNDREVEPPAGLTLLSYLRDQGLTAAKPGCNGGDCGACQVLLGEISPGESVPRFRTVNSCLLTTELVDGCQVITAEGLGTDGPDPLGPVQRALVDAGAIQCGYCTPGIAVALTGGLLAGDDPEHAVAGNLCRCTGYAGIRRAVEQLRLTVPRQGRTLSDASRAGLVAPTVAAASQRLRELPAEGLQPHHGRAMEAGGTDWSIAHAHHAGLVASKRLHRVPDLRGIRVDADGLDIGAAVTVADLQDSADVAAQLSGLAAYLDRFASPAIRHLATVGGNLANASPVADLAVLFLALAADVELISPAGSRKLPLAQFYLGYKHTALEPGEVLGRIRIPAEAGRRLLAEKVAKRLHDDIPAVSAALVATPGEPGRFGRIRLAAGGVAPVPSLLSATAAALTGAPASPATVSAALALLPGEIAPIDDVRGSAAYKARLLQHLVLDLVQRLAPDVDLTGSR